MKCRKINCDKEAHKAELCKKHYYIRTMKYNGHLADIRQVAIERICLQCEKPFRSTGNRRCDNCNYYFMNNDEINLSSFISC